MQKVANVTVEKEDRSNVTSEETEWKKEEETDEKWG